MNHLKKWMDQRMTNDYVSVKATEVELGSQSAQFHLCRFNADVVVCHLLVHPDCLKQTRSHYSWCEAVPELCRSGAI